MTAPSSYRVEAAMSAAQAFAARLRADDPECDHDSLILALDSETDVFDVLRRVIRAAIEADGFADAIAARIKAMAERKARFEARSTAARALAFAMLDALGETTFSDPEFSVSTGKPRARPVVTDFDALPAVFVRTTRAADMTAIGAAIKAGTVPPGVEVTNGTPTLSVRVK